MLNCMLLPTSGRAPEGPWEAGCSAKVGHVRCCRTRTPCRVMSVHGHVGAVLKGRRLVSGLAGQAGTQPAAACSRMRPCALTARPWLCLQGAGAHLGTKNCNYQMERYVYRRRNDGIYVINLEKTWEKLQVRCCCDARWGTAATWTPLCSTRGLALGTAGSLCSTDPANLRCSVSLAGWHCNRSMGRAPPPQALASQAPHPPTRPSSHTTPPPPPGTAPHPSSWRPASLRPSRTRRTWWCCRRARTASAPCSSLRSTSSASRWRGATRPAPSPTRSRSRCVPAPTSSRVGPRQSAVVWPQPGMPAPCMRRVQCPPTLATCPPLLTRPPSVRGAAAGHPDGPAH